MRRRVYISSVLFFLAVLLFQPVTFAAENSEVTLAICRPSVGQIENIVALRDSGMIDLEKLKLICVYHEDELTDYGESFAYVKNNNLKWIEFVKITGRVKIPDFYKSNIWTSQFRSIFENSNGIIFTGGMDIPPALYGEENSLLTEATTPVRTFYETSFLFHLIGGRRNISFVPFLENRRNYPVLGICLGAQTMNVAAGGTMVQDIPSEVYGLKSVEQVLKSGREQIHSSIYRKLMNPEKKDIISPAFHSIKFTDESVLIKTFFKKNAELPLVLSAHHQAMEKTGRNLFVAARSMDGKIIEAVEHRKFKNVLGIQFHPEFRLLYKGIKLFTENPSRGDFFTLRDFLKKHESMKYFHKKLWGWFTKSLKQ